MFTKNQIQTISDFITDKDQVGEGQELVTHSDNTIKRVEQILDYTEQEKQEIDKLMEIVFNIDRLKESGKSIANTMNYNIFILSYKKLDERLKKHFVDIYKELIIEVGTFKINRSLNNPLFGGRYDTSGIKAEIINILSVDSNFDFGIFNNILVLQLVEEIRKK